MMMNQLPREDILIAPAGRLQAVLRLAIRADRIHALDSIGDPHQLATTTITLAPSA